jgi:branched chain amino acid efflux pump
VDTQKPVLANERDGPLASTAMDLPPRSESTNPEETWSLRTVVATMVPLALAIFVFGCIYGVLARPLFGVGSTLLASALIFSGSLQFAIAGLGAQASITSVLALALTLNMRHVLLGAVLRPRIEGGVLRRTLGSWFLTDETFGIAVASRGEAGRILLITGVMGYSTWVIGTALGIAGASLTAFEDFASAAFPVLFIGLASAAATSMDRWIRAAVAVVVVGAISLLAPSFEGIAAVVVAVGVSIPGGTK